MRQVDERETGASAAEYALLIAGIAAVIILGIAVFGGAVLGLFDDSCAAMAAETSAAACP